MFKPLFSYCTAIALALPIVVGASEPVALKVPAKVAVVQKTPATLAPEDTAAARLLGLVLDTYVPKTLHEEKGVPWLGGKRSIKISKVGQATLTSDEQTITVSFPLKAVLAGNVDTNIVLLQIKAACRAEFTAPAAIKLAVDFTKKPLQVSTVIDVVVPPVTADCDGYQLPVQPLLQAVIEQQKPKWQTDIQQQIADGLMVLGI